MNDRYQLLWEWLHRKDPNPKFPCWITGEEVSIDHELDHREREVLVRGIFQQWMTRVALEMLEQELEDGN